MNTRRLRNKLTHKKFKLEIFYRMVLQNFLTLLEGAVIPLLLMGSLALVGFVLWESRHWYAAAGKIEQLNLHIQAKNEVMRTLAQVLGGAFILTGLYFTAKNVFVSRRAQITDRFADALEKLSDPHNMLKRIGGIHALESIARDSPKDHWRIMEIFTNFVRISTTNTEYLESQNKVPLEKRKPREDIQQILNAIGRRTRSFGIGESRPLNLTGANLHGADLQRANLEGANLQETTLSGAILLGAHLRRADFSRANLKGANFNLADLTNVNFHQADLEHANLRNALLKKTSFAMAQMRFACFEGTKLRVVDFPNAVLDNASFEEADLKACDFAGASLKDAVLKDAKIVSPSNLTEAQITLAITNNTTIPDCIRRPSPKGSPERVT